ncbi:hypothetical protein BDV40DRAFT_307053, partial [Aspergillus tamarii]
MLGVMKAGGAFVLLDPSHPRARLEEICRQVSARVILASVAQAEMAEQLAAQVVTVGNGVLALWAKSGGRVLSSSSPDNALYAVFTSGSTGTPKGAVITHAAFGTSASAHGSAFGLSAKSRVLQFSSYAFDASIIEQLTTLLTGGCICTPSDHARQDDLEVVADQLQITWAELTPSTARMLSGKQLGTLATLVLIGEPLTAIDIKMWANRAELINGYGPAECSAISCVRSKIKKDVDALHIGRGMGCVCWVVDADDHERLLPIGAVGELLIEGPIVGRGYLNDPEKTAAAFIDPPAWLRKFRATHPGNPGGDRLYKTGDLVQYVTDGSLRFVGRKDTQVKLRGQRIELGEVEHHVRRCFAGARDVVAEVVTPMEEGRTPMLVAFVLVEDDSMDRKEDILAAPTDAFRAAIPATEAQLQDAVPAYMVPAVFLPLATMPLTATAKTDRRDLRERAAALSRADIEAYSVPAVAKRQPATATERSLQGLWARVLNLPPDAIGADDSFFRLGGDSISAMQLSSLARTAGFSLSVSNIFHSKTIAQLALSLRTEDAVQLDVTESVNVPFDLSPIQSLLFELMPHGCNHFNQSFLLPVAGSVTPDDLDRSLYVIVDCHSMLRARFDRSSNGAWTQTISPDVESSYRFRQFTFGSLEDARSSMQASQRGLNVRDGPLLSVDLFNISAGQRQQYIFLVAHHLVIDLVSWRIILGDLEDLLQSSQLPGNTPLPFQSWCQMQVDYARDSLPPGMALSFTLPAPPHDYWGPVNDRNTWDNAVHSGFRLSEMTTATLFGKANDALQTQPVEVFQAALWHAFVRTFPDRPPPAIFNEGHGREPWDPAIDLSRTVGWFTTLWPLSIEMDSRTADIVEVVRRCKDARRRMPRNGWAYFTSRFLNPDGQRAFGMHGPVEIAFNYVGLYQQFEREGAIFKPPITLEDHVPDVAGDVARFALIDVSASVEKGCLCFSFSYNRHMQHQDGIRRWIVNCEQSLREAAERLTVTERKYTLCDFPLLSLSYEDLDMLMDKIRSQSPSLGVEDAYPCSPMQRGILISQAKDARHYWTNSVWKVVPTREASPVDLGRLQRAWQQVVDRHAILRTIFVESVSQAGYVDQVVRAEAPAEIHIVEDTGDGDLVATVERHVETAGRESQSLHRLILCATPTGIFCALTINHALIDAHSIRILERDLRLAYDSKLPAGQAPLYSDYISYLQDLPEPAAEAYWNEYMDGVGPCLFPISSDGDLDSNKRIERQAFINLGSGELLRDFCEKYDVTLSNLFRVAWGIVLQIYTGLDSVCFGYLNSGRDVPVSGADDTVGPFINLLICRMNLASDIPVLSLVQANRDEYLKGLPHQHYPLAGVLHLAGTVGEPLFNTVLSVQRAESGGVDETSIGLERVGGHDPTEYDIAVTIGIEPTQIAVYLNYRPPTLDEQRAKLIGETFKQVVFSMAERPSSTACLLNVISKRDMEQIHRWNATVPVRVERCVHDLIVEQCRAQPDAPAV